MRRKWYICLLGLLCVLSLIFVNVNKVQAQAPVRQVALIEDVVQTNDPTDVSGLVMGAVVALIGIVALVYYQVKGKHQK